MDLSLFCDTYIIAEYFRLTGILENMPRYKTGSHNGYPVIREYSGRGDDKKTRVAHLNGKIYSEMQKKLELFNNTTKAKNIYGAEISRRYLIIPKDFKLIREPSEFDMNAWDQMEAAANSFEQKPRYFDDFGFNVRSRGEMFVGNVLKELGLEAKYEPMILLNSGKKKCPDYSFPVPVIGRCFFAEFFGMSENDGYINYNYGKIEEYMRNGILPNRDLILICGAEKWMPSHESIKRMIASFINNAVLRTYNRKW